MLRGPQTCSILKFVVSSFGLHFVRLTEGSVLTDLGVTSLITLEDGGRGGGRGVIIESQEPPTNYL
jgi:hypothetical protein